MHAVFMLYGKKEWVDILIRDMSAQKLPLVSHKEGEPDVRQLIDCQVRILPFGLYEFVFPKEFEDVVLTTLDFHKKTSYNLDKEISIMRMKFKPLNYLRKFLNIEEPKDFKTEQQLPWIKEFVSIIPIGVRYDGEVTEPDGSTHEAI